MAVLISIGLIFGMAWILSGLLESILIRYYDRYSYPQEEMDVPEPFLFGSVGCPYCRNLIQIEDVLVSCNACKTLHHYECWATAKRCSVFGCEGMSERTVLF